MILPRCSFLCAIIQLVVSKRSWVECHNAGIEKPRAKPAKLFPTGHALISKRTITPSNANDSTNRRKQMIPLFIALSPPYWNIDSVFCNAYAIFHNIAFDVVIAVKVGMFYYAIAPALDFTSELVPSFCLWTDIFYFPENRVRRWAICIFHITTNLEIVR